MLSPNTINKNFDEILRDLGMAPQNSAPAMEVEAVPLNLVKVEKCETGNPQGK